MLFLVGFYFIFHHYIMIKRLIPKLKMMIIFEFETDLITIIFFQIFYFTHFLFSKNRDFQHYYVIQMLFSRCSVQYNKLLVGNFFQQVCFRAGRRVFFINQENSPKQNKRKKYLQGILRISLNNVLIIIFGNLVFKIWFEMNLDEIVKNR